MTEKEVEAVRVDLNRFTMAIEQTVADLYEEIRLLREKATDGSNE